MGLDYNYKLTAPATKSLEELRAFLKEISEKATAMGFSDVAVIRCKNE